MAGAGVLLILLGGMIAWLIVRQLLPSAPVSQTSRQASREETPLRDDFLVELPVIGAYQVERQIGRGSMGVVYLGKEAGSGREVAIKTLALANEFDPDQLADVRARFFREAETAGRLKHPGIVTVLASGEARDLAWIAMEYLQGKSLQEWTAPDRLLPLPEVLAIVRQVALALDYAHKQQVVHRDIKPANVIYDPAACKIKVTDFGVARMTDANRTRTGLVLGTPAFMSPEQLAGKHIDSRSDLFSLGVMLFQLTTGQLPFSGESLGQLMYSISHDAPKDPKKIKPELPAALVAIIMKALQKETANRFQTGAHFALALARLEAFLKGKEPHG